MTTLQAATTILTPSLARQGAQLRQQIDRVVLELSTGTTGDRGAAVGGDYRALAGLETALSRLDAYSLATTEAQLLAGTMQQALGVIDGVASDLLSNMTTVTTVQTAGQLAAVAAQGGVGFEIVINILNGSAGGRSLFGGIVSTTNPLPDAQSVLVALQGAISGAGDAQSAKAAIADWFADPSGFASLYSGGDPRSPMPIATGEAADLGVTALDPDLRGTLQGLATMALLDRGFLAGSHAERQALAAATVDTLAGSAAGRSEVAMRIGVAEQAIADAISRNSAETSALTIARNGMIEADPYEAATHLQDLETRLDAFYTLVSRLSRLSLTEYL